MNTLNNVPSQGTFGQSIAKINENFSLLQEAISELSEQESLDLGYFLTSSELQTAYPSPVVGMSATVGTQFEIYRCTTEGVWSATGEKTRYTQQVVDSLPSNPDAHTIYALQGTDSWTEQVYSNGAWVVLATHSGAIPEITVDATPTKNSTNPVQSGGVYNSISQIIPKTLRESSGGGFQITDGNGYVGLSFNDGKLDVVGVGENLEGIISEEAEDVVKNSDLTMRLVQEDGLFVVDKDGNIGFTIFGGDNSETKMSVTLDFEQKRAEFLSNLSSKYLIKNSIKWIDSEIMTGNPVMNFSGTSVVDKETNSEYNINQESDNICPISFSKYENLGGNHGFATKKVLCSTSGLSYSLLGKQLTCNGTTFYAVRLLDDGFIVMPSHIGDTFNSISINANDVITGDGISISVVSVSSVQMYPVCLNCEKKILVDGVLKSESGTYSGENVEFVDIYDIFDPISYLDNIIANVGNWNTNPTIETVEPDYLVRRSIMYRFEKGGLCLIFDNFSALKDVSITSEYGLNIKPMNAAGVTNGVKKYYLPKSLPIVYDKTTGRRATNSTLETNKVTFDFRTPTTQTPASIPNFETLGDAGLNFVADDCENGQPIERGVCLLDFNNGRILLEHGYAFPFPVGGNDRLKYTDRPWRMRALGNYWTIYPQGYRSGAELFSGNVEKGETYGYVCFRKYADAYNDAVEGILHTFGFYLGGDFYVYTDFLSPGTYTIAIPKECYGNKVDILYKRDNVFLLNAVATDEIQFSVVESDSGIDYGYCLIKL